MLSAFFEKLFRLIGLIEKPSGPEPGTWQHYLQQSGYRFHYLLNNEGLVIGIGMQRDNWAPGVFAGIEGDMFTFNGSVYEVTAVNNDTCTLDIRPVA